MSYDAMTLIAVPEDLSPPSVLHPLQFQEIWSGVRRSPERELAMAIVDRAAVDLLNFRHARHPHEQRLYVRAYQWMASDDCSWPFSFRSICDALEISAAALRERLFDVRRTRDAA
jgi:hypothetical protein